MHLEGHSAPKDVLRQLSAHTLLFVGPERVGRRRAAKWYAALLNCEQAGAEPCGDCLSCQLFAEDNHPDYREIAPELTTSTGRSNRRPELKIGQLVTRKESSDDLPLGPWLEPRPRFNWRVGVIDQAHTLNISAANAFLKTLEEPPLRTKIILISPSSQAMLPTIASRSSVVRFAPSQDLAAFDFPLARLGRFGDQFLKDANQDISDLIERYVISLNQTLEEAFEAADALEKQWETHPDATDVLLAQMSKQSPERYAKANQALEQFNEALSAYASLHLAMQVLTLELRTAFRN